MRSVFIAFLLVLSAAGPAAAQLNRAFVSVNGSDANACTPGAPCRSFGAALALTNPGGEVIALDSGGYGPFVVDRSVSVIAPPGVHAGVIATLGDAVYVDAGAGGKVVLRGLALDGRGPGSRGIAFGGSGASLHVEHCTIDEFGNGSGIFFGLAEPASLFVRDTVVRSNNLAGFWMNSTAPVRAFLDRVEVAGNELYGVLIAANVTAVIRNTLSTGNDHGFYAANGGSATLQNCTADRNEGYGAAGFGGSVARLSGCVITGNTTGISGTIHSWGNNRIAGNLTNIGTPAVPLTPN